VSKLDKVLYTAKVHTTGGRSGVSRSSDGHLDVKLTRYGTPGDGTNPEQLFAAGWSACFESAMTVAAQKMKVMLPPDVAVDAEVDLGPTDGAYGLAARLNVHLPGIEREVAERLLEVTHKLCPYSRATRGNIDVMITLI
jgi:osmotically inducible protein OsmC